MVVSQTLEQDRSKNLDLPLRGLNLSVSLSCPIWNGGNREEQAGARWGTRHPCAFVQHEVSPLSRRLHVLRLTAKAEGAVVRVRETECEVQVGYERMWGVAHAPW